MATAYYITDVGDVSRTSIAMLWTLSEKTNRSQGIRINRKQRKHHHYKFVVSHPNQTNDEFDNCSIFSRPEYA